MAALVHGSVGYAAPRVLLTTAGPALFPWAEGEGYLTTWIPGESPTANADNAFLLGRATGALHAISPAAHNLPAATFTIESARAHFHELDADPAVNGWEGYAQMRIGLHDAWNSLGDLAKLPKTIVHTDVHFGNAVRTPSGEVVLIDWDDTGLGPAITDVGYYLIHQAVPSDEGGDWAPEMARAFLAGYESVRPLAPAERERLPEAMLFGALAYVLAPWEDRVHVGNWRRARAVLDQREEIEAMIAG